MFRERRSVKIWSCSMNAIPSVIVFLFVFSSRQRRRPKRTWKKTKRKRHQSEETWEEAHKSATAQRTRGLCVCVSQPRVLMSACFNIFSRATKSLRHFCTILWPSCLKIAHVSTDFGTCFIHDFFFLFFKRDLYCAWQTSSIEFFTHVFGNEVGKLARKFWSVFKSAH